MTNSLEHFSWLALVINAGMVAAALLILTGIGYACKRRAPKPEDDSGDEYLTARDMMRQQREHRNRMLLSRKCVVCGCEIVVTAVDKTRGRCANCGQPWSVSRGLLGRKKAKP